MNERRGKKRRGVVSIWVLLVLSMLTVFLATTTWQYVTSRRLQRERHDRVQAEWLARAGLELAVARLIADSSYRGETAELIPDARVKVEVRSEVETPNVFQVSCEVEYPTRNRPKAATRSLQRTFRRVGEKEDARLEVVPPKVN